MKKRGVYKQPPLRGGRDPLFSCVLPATRAAALREAARYNVSPSWLVATVLAQALGVPDQVSYKLAGKLKNGKAK